MSDIDSNRLTDPAETLDSVPRLVLPSPEVLIHEAEGQNTELHHVFDLHFADTNSALGTNRLNAGKIFSGLNAMLRIWAATQHDPVTQNIHNSIATYSTVMKRHPGLEGPDLEVVLRHYDEYVFQSLGLITLGRDKADRASYTQQQRGVYNLDGPWVPIPHAPKADSIDFARIEVVSAAAEIEADTAEEAIDLFHNTSSASLQTIGTEGAILSARAAEEKKLEIVSGEYLHAGEYERGDGRFNFVYASNMLGTGYSTKRWFDEYPVVFGFNSSEIEDYAHKMYRHRPSYSGVSGNGHEIPDSIPLSLVRGVYAPQRKVEELNKWSVAAIPHAPAYALEAGMLLRKYVQSGLRRYPRYPYRFEDPRARDSAMMMNIDPIVVQP